MACTAPLNQPTGIEVPRFLQKPGEFCILDAILCILLVTI